MHCFEHCSTCPVSQPVLEIGCTPVLFSFHLNFRARVALKNCAIVGSLFFKPLPLTNKPHTAGAQTELGKPNVIPIPNILTL